MTQVLDTLVDATVYLPTPSPLFLALWAALWVGYLVWKITAHPVLVRSRTERALDRVLSAGEAEVAPTRPTFEPETPSWAQTPVRLGLGVALFLAGLLAFGPGAVPLALGGIGYLLPGLFLDRQRRKALASVEEDLPDLLVSLSAGARLTEDIAELLDQAAQDLATKASDRPMARLLREAAARARSAGAEEALLWLEAQAPSPLLKRVAYRLRLYARAGGGMADLLEESARRQRRRMEGITRARSFAEGAIGLSNLLIVFTVLGLGMSLFLNDISRAFYRSQVGQIALVLILSFVYLGRILVRDMADDVR